MKKICLSLLHSLLFLQISLAQVDNPTPAEKLFAQAREAFSSGDDKTVITKLNEALRLQPDYGDAYALRGQAYLQLGDCANAIADLNKALEKNPFDPETIHKRLAKAQRCDIPIPIPLEVLWEAPESDKVQVNADRYTIQACVKGAKMPIQLMHDGIPVLSTTHRGTSIVSICDSNTTNISQQVILKVGINIFYIQSQGRRSETKTIIYVPTNVVSNRRLAVVIGNDDYLGDRLDLKGVPLRDAALMRDSLKKCGFDVSYYHDLKKAELELVLKNFITELNTNSYEAALFYFAGHGLLIHKYGFIIPTDVNLRTPEDVEQQCVSLDHLKNKMVQSRAKLSILLTDACRDNPFKSIKDKLNINSNPFSFTIQPPTQTNHEFFMAYPAGEGQTVENKGWFTTQWVKHMMIHLNLGEVMRRTTEAVKTISTGKQSPESYGASSKDFFFK